MSNAAAFHAFSNVIATIGAVTAMAVLLTAMMGLLGLLMIGQSKALAAPRVAPAHRFEATAYAAADGDRYVHVKAVGMACPIGTRAAINDFAASVRAKGYVVDHVGRNEVHVREGFARLFLSERA